MAFRSEVLSREDLRRCYHNCRSVAEMVLVTPCSIPVGEPRIRALPSITFLAPGPRRLHWRNSGRHTSPMVTVVVGPEPLEPSGGAASRGSRPRRLALDNEEHCHSFQRTSQERCRRMDSTGAPPPSRQAFGNEADIYDVQHLFTLYIHYG